MFAVKFSPPFASDAYYNLISFYSVCKVPFLASSCWVTPSVISYEIKLSENSINKKIVASTTLLRGLGSHRSEASFTQEAQPLSEPV